MLPHKHAKSRRCSLFHQIFINAGLLFSFTHPTICLNVEFLQDGLLLSENSGLDSLFDNSVVYYWLPWNAIDFFTPLLYVWILTRRNKVMLITQSDMYLNMM